MLQKEIQHIIAFNFAKIKDLNYKFQLYDLQNAQVHPAIVKYILKTIDYQILIEKKFIQKNSKFDYSGEKIEKLFKLISLEVKKEKEFSSTFIKDIIEEAVKFNVSFLVKPNSTLTNFIFEDNKDLPLDVIFSKLKFIYYYKYIAKLAQLFLEKKNVNSISRKEFALLLNKIEQITKRKHLQNLIYSSFNSMANFFDQTNSSPSQLPFDAVIMFLEEKELNDFSQRLKLKYEIERPDTLDIGDIETLFKSDFDGIDLSITENLKLTEDKIQLEDISFSENQESNLDRFTSQNKSNLISEDKTEIKNEKETNNETDIQNNEEITNENVNDNTNKFFSVIVDESKNIPEPTNEEKLEIADNVVEDSNNKVSENENALNEETSIDIINIDEKPDVKKLIKNLIDVNSIYSSLIRKTNAFDDYKLRHDISLRDVVNSINLQIDVSNISEDIIIEIPSEEEYIGIVNDRHIELVEDYDEEELLESETQSEIINGEKEKIAEKIGNEIDDKQNEDLNESIDEMINDIRNEEEFEEYNTNKSINELDNDEKQDMENLLDENKLKLTDDEEITEVFSDLNYLENAESEEQELDLEKKSEAEEKKINNETENIESEDDPQSDVKVIYSTFNEFISTRNMSNIIETIFDYDMEDYYGIVGKISNAFNENEALRITNDYCKNNHIDILNNDVIEFKTYITEYFTQS